MRHRQSSGISFRAPRELASLLALLLMLCASSASFAQAMQIRLPDGTRWRGKVDDTVSMVIREGNIEQSITARILRDAETYIVVEATIAGIVREKTIFKADIVSMKAETAAAVGEPAKAPGKRNEAASASTDVPRDVSGRELGVFYLPMEGMVGESFRHEEILKIGEEADKHGPGQIIILGLASNGGLVIETLKIEEAIMKVRERHRVIAWVNNKAISAGCMTAMYCNEIYFTTEGTAGSVTTLAGASSVQGEEGEKHVEQFVESAKKNGYSEHIARAMKMNRFMCSYDKDPDTGDVTFYGDLSGKYVLSDGDSNLCFNASNALHCGFSKGTVDTEDELARALNLPKWHEISDYGRRIAKDWQETCKQANEEIPRLVAQREYKNVGLDPVARIGALIQIDRKLIRWTERCPNVVFLTLGPPEEVRKALEREIRELQRELADRNG